MILNIHNDSSSLGNAGFLVSIFPTFLLFLVSATSLTQTVLILILSLPLILYPLLDFISIFNILKSEKIYLKKIVIFGLIMISESILIMLSTDSTHNIIGLLMFIFMPSAFIFFLILKNDDTTEYLLNNYIVDSNTYKLVFCKICGKIYTSSPVICGECRNNQLFKGNMIDYQTMILSFYSYKYGPYLVILLFFLLVIFKSYLFYVMLFSVAGLTVISRWRNRIKYNIYGAHTPNKNAHIISESLRSKRPTFGLKEITSEIAIPLFIVISSLIYLLKRI